MDAVYQIMFRKSNNKRIGCKTEWVYREDFLNVWALQMVFCRIMHKMNNGLYYSFCCNVIIILLELRCLDMLILRLKMFRHNVSSENIVKSLLCYIIVDVEILRVNFIWKHTISFFSYIMYYFIFSSFMERKQFVIGEQILRRHSGCNIIAKQIDRENKLRVEVHQFLLMLPWKTMMGWWSHS